MANRASWAIMRALVLVGLIAGAAPAAAIAPTVCVVSQTDVLQRSQPALGAGVQLQQARQAAQADYDAALREIDSDARMLTSLKGALPPAVAQSRLQDIANRRIALQRTTETVNRGLADLNATLSRRVMQQAAPIIHDIAQAHGCWVVFARETAWQMIDPSADLTAAVLDKLATPPPPANGSR